MKPSVVLLWTFALAISASSQEPSLQSEDLPRIPPTPPEKALGTFQVRDGLKIELAAAEPLVADPITMAFDEDSRLYVIEMRDYSERREEALGQVKVLVDSDGDGRFDRSSILAENLAWPTALFPWDGGVFVGATPHLYYFKDADGDGRAEIKKEIFNGFGSTSARLNVQMLFNSLNWSLDNRIHGANGGNSGILTQRDGSKLPLGGYDFSFDPRNLDLRLESGGGQYGLSFDSHGHKFVCSNSSHIRQVMYESRYATSQIIYNLPPPAIDIPVDGPAAEVFRISPDEPWRVIRTKWRVSGLVSGIIEGGGRPSGYFTGATGITIYRGDALGAEFENNAFVGDAGGNLVHRKRLTGNGLPYQAVRAEDERQSEFVASTDTWFRPVHFANAPDGALYILDMYREVIEHPWSIPPNLKKHLDLNSGNQRGRIYRVVPKGFKQPVLPRLSSASGEELVRLLEHKNGWHRETASRLIYQRQDQSINPSLTKMAKSSSSEFGRMHALYALAGLSSLSQEIIAAALEDKSLLVRRHALRLGEKFLSSGTNSPLLSSFQALAKDPSLEVRYQLAWTATKLPPNQSAPLLAEMLQNDPGGWEKMALLASASRAPALVHSKLTTNSTTEITAALAELIGNRNTAQEVRALLKNASELPSERALPVIASLQSGLKKTGATLWSAPYQHWAEPLLQKAMAAAKGENQPEAAQLAAVRLLGEQPSFPNFARDWLQSKNTSRGAIYEAILRQLAAQGTPAARQLVLDQWKKSPSALKPQLLQLLLSRPSEWRPIMQAVASGVIARTDFTTSQVESFRKGGDAETRTMAQKLFGKGSQATRLQVVEKYLDAARMKGDAEKGRAILEQRCLICHQLNGTGQPLGPALESVRSAGKQSLLVNILDPNREVSPRYAAYEIQTRDGEAFTGVIASENATAINLLMPGGAVMELRREQIVSVEPTGKSLMPEQLEEGLSQQDVADLLEAIAQ